jgi:hypothetical protein
VGVLFSCSSAGRAQYEAWDAAFTHAPSAFSSAVTALWIASYQEDPQTHRFVRSTAWGNVPEKLVPDGQGGYSVAVALLVQTETSDGPGPDRFLTVLLRVYRSGDRFTLGDNEALPGKVVGWHDPSHRTVWFRGRTGEGDATQTLWQFRGRY